MWWTWILYTIGILALIVIVGGGVAVGLCIYTIIKIIKTIEE